ncbi:hypothetical protein Pla52n_65780 [Stieleria varia]|uniref:Uncharacterized protein n=1 Tax=Stieleria varia TaxID=2528005 RepID=A0A5C5ZX89_9BACT|nr:hypothetical protein Pla52n_65780 [Stieleria varia]
MPLPYFWCFLQHFPENQGCRIATESWSVGDWSFPSERARFNDFIRILAASKLMAHPHKSGLSFVTLFRRFR